MNDAAILAAAVGQLRRYRVAFLEIATAAGADTSDIDDPDQLKYPPIEQYALEAVKELHQSYNEELSTDPQCSGSPYCNCRTGSASGETGTDSTLTFTTLPQESVPNAGMESPRTGTSSDPAEDYLDILREVIAGLRGEWDTPPTALLNLAVQAIEYELAERMLNALG